MRIQHNILAMNSYRQYSINNSALGKNLEKLSSGYKINRAGDDAAGLAVSEKMRAQISAVTGAMKNTKDGISFIQTAEGALQEVNDMLKRMYSLAEQSANGTYDDDTDRNNLQMELNSLRTEIDRIGQSANFNGMYLFTKHSGSTDNILRGSTAFAIDDMGVASAAYGMLTMTFSDTFKVNGNVIGSLSVKQLGIDSSKVSIATAASAMSSMSVIRTAIKAISSIRGKLGAYQNRLEHTANNLGVMRENLQDSESTIRDTDVAEEMMKFTKNSILNQSAQAMLAQANQVPQGVLQLLQ